MSKPKQIMNPLANFYRSHIIDAFLYGWICGAKFANPDTPLKEIINMFILEFDFDCNFEPQELMQTYYRMHEKFINKKN